ncbi:hypothetical protein C8J56DRAFT_969183 [Mycena floridula]|nr:hypothetical protein C8J56DRAFT_969183 [Mycena floridula]
MAFFFASIMSFIASSSEDHGCSGPQAMMVSTADVYSGYCIPKIWLCLSILRHIAELRLGCILWPEVRAMSLDEKMSST